ncbi:MULTISPECIES: Lrp/AsnC family transcriptional regulator [unclassified Herbaspirillum]|uniref:Lrp/AsnC family transcriptional regulator n=1 Tax=unclassified Herbaspirillum TaxID=2624150 RepID=UPI001150F171|nr:MULTISPECIES: Lrp/AsnC family transcriptional regulator [unclassified Herbaspirillum]MBB5390089.1 Lrp/AsnC family leucine-responsive transcriptional regulator [Herbaspirillum sp. SJZ102]TQK09412.1 Lrp/AsnC family leucine-responsive transcriptional regulator [Herbaspirillum sp. SJZ130]TQK13901.1 Lrp/AsnC family leucine-responsive transcriptional regulator [Herbaspirillum sp. SJZ106]TWC69625.1 Lrp/AsnC family leucine-responsive transcriptional regulator [Herbaspirillum sp. SJZ099]
MKLELDDLDRRILKALQSDASQTNHQLAASVHASPPTCLRRVRRLTEAGVIARQVALLDTDKLASTLTAIVEITLDRQGDEEQQSFESLVADEPAVQQCYRVSPGPDFVLVVLVADMPAYHALAHRLFASQKNVRNVRSYFSVLRSKFETAVPIDVQKE